jgi:hypothetical protein
LSREEATKSDCRRSSDGGGGAARAPSESRVACGAARAPRVAGGRRSGPEGAKVEEVRLRQRWHSRHEEEEDVGVTDEDRSRVNIVLVKHLVSFTV